MKLSLITVALVGALSLSACGGEAEPGASSKTDLAKKGISVMEKGDYDGLARLCSPSTRVKGTSDLVFAKALDPKGEMLKAVVAELKADLADGVYDGTDEGNEPVQVDGRWFLDCSE